MHAIKKISPLIFFVIILALLCRGLYLPIKIIPSPLINKTAPAFQLPDLFDPKKTITNSIFLGQVTLFNVWASWCITCTEESDMLLQLANREHLIIYGLNYKDDAPAAKNFLKKFGNPYKRIAMDQTSETAINWGVYGTPETYIVDKKGVIRDKYIGAITQSVWEKQLKPLIAKLRSEEP